MTDVMEIGPKTSVVSINRYSRNWYSLLMKLIVPVLSDAPELLIASIDESRFVFILHTIAV